MRFLSLVLMLLVIASVGCGGTQSASQETESSNLKPLAVFYGRYVAQHRGQPPANEAEFKKFLSSLPPEELQQFAVDSVESLLVSSRDGQPYVVVYGKPTGPPLGPGGMPIIAYEQTGVNGKRFVASSIGGIEEVDAARFQELVPTTAP